MVTGGFHQVDFSWDYVICKMRHIETMQPMQTNQTTQQPQSRQPEHGADFTTASSEITFNRQVWAAEPHQLFPRVTAELKLSSCCLPVSNMFSVGNGVDPLTSPASDLASYAAAPGESNCCHTGNSSRCLSVFSRQTREPRRRRRHRHVGHRGTVSRTQPSGTNISSHRGLLFQLCALLFPGISWRVSDGHCVSYMATRLSSSDQSWKRTGRKPDQQQ